MSNKKENNQCNIKSKIGGQALIEGIMMRGIHKGAMACRLPNGEIDLETWNIKGGKEAPWYRKMPFVRGSVNMVQSMMDGIKYISKSSDKQMEDEEEEKGKFELWLIKKFGDKASKGLSNFVMGLGMLLGIAIAVGLFAVFPIFITSLLKSYIENTFLLTLIEGVIKIVLLVAYMGLTGLIKDIKITYQYHGAEHKAIFCYENREELTVENVKKQSRFHPRCGTSFLLIAFVISILVFSLVTWSSGLQRFILKMVLLPVVVGIAYEIIKLAGRFDNPFTRIISAPGLALQKITTKEPSDKQIEVAIKALEAVIPENLEEDKW